MQIEVKAVDVFVQTLRNSGIGYTLDTQRIGDAINIMIEIPVDHLIIYFVNDKMVIHNTLLAEE